VDVTAKQMAVSPPSSFLFLEPLPSMACLFLFEDKGAKDGERDCEPSFGEPGYGLERRVKARSSVG
jgi:hypothetical protein